MTFPRFSLCGEEGRITAEKNSLFPSSHYPAASIRCFSVSLSVCVCETNMTWSVCLTCQITVYAENQSGPIQWQRNGCDMLGSTMERAELFWLGGNRSRRTKTTQSWFCLLEMKTNSESVSVSDSVWVCCCCCWGFFHRAAGSESL